MPTVTNDAQGITELAKAVIETERQAIGELLNRIDDSFVKAVQTLMACEGRIIVTGIGKSGHIGSKIAATFASTGSPAYFMHAAEASHGDMGLMKAGDVVVAISYSGSSDELMKLVPGIKRLGLPLIALCGEPNSTLAQTADIVLDVSVEREACPLGLAPTASTTSTLVTGDALAVSLLHSRGFNEADFARSHPGGRLGRQLLLHVSDVMSSGDALPKVDHKVALPEALIEISKKGLGMVAIVDAQDHLMGVFTDGDLRRSLEQHGNIHNTPITDVMTRGGLSIEPDALAIAAVEKMQQHKITALPVIDSEKVVGIITMHALFAADVV